MTFPRHLLLAVDGSTQGQHAAEAAADLTTATGATLDILHVAAVTQWTAPRVLRDEQLDRFREDGQRLLDAQVREMAARNVPVRQQYLRLGRVVDEVLRMQEQLSSDLIVVGNRGMNAFSRILLGSDAKNIMVHAPCPVLIVRKDER